MPSLGHMIRTKFTFVPSEVYQMLITAAVAGFVMGFDKWGSGNTVNVGAGIQNLIFGAIFVFLALSAHVLAQKLVGLKLGYIVSYAYWKMGLLIGALITFLTNGFIPLFFTGGLNTKVFQRVRVGVYQPRFKFWDFAIVSFGGPLANLLLVLIAKPFYIWLGTEWVMLFIVSNLLVMVYSMIPIPHFHGVKVIEAGRTAYDIQGGTIGFNLFLANRGIWVFMMAMMLIYALLIMIGGIFSLLAAFLVAVIVTIVFYTKLETS